VAKRQPAVHGVRDAIRAEHLLEQRGVAARLAEHHSHVARLDAVAQQLEHARGGQLHLGALASRRVERDRRAGLGRRRRLVLEQEPLEVVERGARLGRVVIVERGQLELLGAEREQLLVHPGDRLERRTSALEGK
jgi:hypothetical protein